MAVEVTVVLYFQHPPPSLEVLSADLEDKFDCDVVTIEEEEV